ncbi:MAG: hypothetical protein A3G59_01985 [Candidatus Taylorbacteria bacterium RIFCSPLOWO2_12_FULL_47_20]|uniref:M23ase beta-sheet core domain-containing protein n=2 Tax=Candidatus Tayloriibacteriota TaxID=1817919 RepID=A0A1G2P967_9BACT|nr:MAG: hypothetical protein A3H68_02555 [Candidatus Taylorbacteria bacterium RIFCSPLOWO2_02_FULL_46_40]OHA44111.1 MAG: hypothetical protein A3G59_01985 [Candidatus Taylorbacteria bacterium RIFCSPLOWO2_12_FULL_47_20]
MIDLHTKAAAVTALVLASLFYGAFLPINIGNAEDLTKMNDLQSKIAERTKAIEELEKEIAGYQNQIELTKSEAESLRKAINTLEITRKKLAADISLTNVKIGTVNLTIEELQIEISETEASILKRKESIGKGIRRINENDHVDFVEIVFGASNLSQVLDATERMREVQTALFANIAELGLLKSSLDSKVASNEKKKTELTTLNTRLSDQKQIAEQNKKEKDELLKKTRNKESQYQQSLKEKMAIKEAFESELLEFERQLRFEMDSSKLPAIGSGVLSYPLSNPFITQTFGMTDFAKSGAYDGRGHNGVDFRAAIGTPITASADGKVVGTGDTDTVCPGASYGKWVLIEHGNGLSTLYGHLSLPKVSAGEAVLRGTVIGYSGNTGYSTGPHLHFTVYAADGVKIMEKKSQVCKGTYTMPVADLRAYLNPIDYL